MGEQCWRRGEGASSGASTAAVWKALPPAYHSEGFPSLRSWGWNHASSEHSLEFQLRIN